MPTGHDAQDQFSDAAATTDEFLLVRPATVDGVPAADVYRSGNGTAWTFAATLTTPADFTPGLMNGSSEGAVLAGQSGRTLTAFMSSDGARWRQVPAFGSAAAETISGVAATKTGAVVAAGMSGATAGEQRRRQSAADHGGRRVQRLRRRQERKAGRHSRGGATPACRQCHRG